MRLAVILKFKGTCKTRHAVFTNRSAAAQGYPMA